MEKKLLLAVTLSIIVMLLYPLFIAKVNPPPAQGDFISQQVENKEVVATHITEESPKDILATLPADAESKRVNTSRYEINLSNIGGSVQGIRIKDGKRLDIDLVQDAIYESGILAIEGKGALADLSSQPFALKEDTNSFYVEKNGLAIDKKIIFLKDKYALKASINITNNFSSTQSLSFEITTASNISDKESWETRYIGADVLYRDGRVKRVASYNSKKYNQLYQSDIEWLALRNKYYSIIAKPEFIPQGIFTKKIGTAPVVGFIVDEKI
ncbi:MAG: YidC/Oxa1 family insertase periplasmic-domain containing protein, partial [Candidatus Omnitrophica bacterium]|nr:YidC/Oxa1 family insertase periplasmic-domain containing protein [Candidatus Omnitrophota bacterium]